MIQLEVFLNDEKLAIAGTDDMSVLSAVLSASGVLGENSQGTKTEDESYHINLHVGGLTSRKPPETDDHLTWVNQLKVKIGDEVKVRVVENLETSDPIKIKTTDKNVFEDSEKTVFEKIKKEYLRLKDKYE
jgi:hypothetical protein